MKLYDVANGSLIRVLKKEDITTAPDSIPKEYQLNIYDEIDAEYEHPVHTPIGAPSVDRGDLLFFSHIDGMYSICYKYDPDATLKRGEMCHIAAWTEVEVVQLYEVFNFEFIRQIIGRSGYGKNGDEEYREAKLCEMSDTWIINSIDYVKKYHRGFDHLRYYEMELKYRKDNGISIPD